jgi:hypothetical protein
MNNAIRIHGRIITTLLFLSTLVAPLTAQPQIDIRAVRPQQDFFYRIYLAANCNGQPVTRLLKQQINISQDGIPIIPFNYSIYRQPPAFPDACFNAGLVFDRSNFLPPSGNRIIAAAAGRFIDSMARDCQQATIVSYSNAVDIHEFLTSDTARLRVAASRLASPGANRTYDLIDGIQAAMTEIQTNGFEQFRVIIAFSAGGDNLSDQRINELISSMQYSFFRIFVVTTAPAADSAAFVRLTKATGGRVIAADSLGKLPDIYGFLAGWIKRELDEFQILYQSPRTYPPPRTLTVGISFCSDSTIGTYAFLGNVTSVLPDPLPCTLRLSSFPQPLHGPSPRLTLLLSADPAAIGKIVDIRLTDILGRRISEVPPVILQDSETEIAIALDRVPRGLYLCHATVGTRRTTHTIMVSE